MKTILLILLLFTGGVKAQTGILGRIVTNQAPETIVFSGNPIQVALIGNSTVAAFDCRATDIAFNLFTSAEKTAGYTGVNLAVPGHTIDQQQAVWEAHANKLQYDVIVIELGLNDIGTGTSGIISRLQALITTINATKKTGAKLIINVMTPARQRWYDTRSAQQAPLDFASYLQVNDAIMNRYSTNITGVDYRNEYHYPLMADAQGNLLPEYDCGDHIHQNFDGMVHQVDGIRLSLKALNYN